MRKCKFRKEVVCVKILILSCDTGQGHNSAANAVKEAFERRKVQCEVFDPLTLGGRKAAKLVSDAYTGMMKKMPSAFGVMYEIGDKYSQTGITSPVYRANSRYSEELKTYILDGDYTAVICTHLFPMEALTALKKKDLLDIPCFGVLTDYTCIPFFAETALDAYFIPHPDLISEMKAKGLGGKIYPSGIPVSGKFSDHCKKSEARKKLGLDENLPMILVMSGGIGVGHISELCGELKANDEAFSACILCGKNTELLDNIRENFAADKRFVPLEYTDEVNLYMNSADVMISKPGGLTSTEAAVANVPLVQLLAYTGCELRNIEFFASRGLSLRAGNAKEASELAFMLIGDRKRADEIIAAQRANIPQNAADSIAETVIGYE